jgi:hypothetical protein
MRTSNLTLPGALALILAGCGDDGAGAAIDAPTNPPIDAPTGGATYRQIEQLARPAINEALLISSAFNDGYNATAPSFAGVPDATLGLVVDQAKTVLQAIYLGTCLINGAAELTIDTGFHPAGLACNAVGGALFTENSLTGETLTETSKAAAKAYATKVFDQFIPDVLRIDTSAPSGYFTLCGTPSSKPLLCGGRNLNDDVIDITYNYLLSGAAITRASQLQLRALVSDGVVFSFDDSKNAGNVSVPDPSNAAQDHLPVSDAFPYSAAPF